MYVLKQREISLNTDYDVIVVGGGPAGCGAAASAAREGAKTLLIEGTAALGGMGTGGLLTTWCPYTDGVQIVYRGIAERVFRETCAQMPVVKEGELSWVAIDNEVLKRVYDNLMEEYGVDVLFSTSISDVDTDDSGNVEAILVTNKNGLTAYKAKTYVDCTGDGDLCAFAGAEFQTDGERMPATHCFMLTNVNEEEFLEFNKFMETHINPFEKMVADEKYDLIISTHSVPRLIGPRTVGFNTGHIWNVDSTDAESVSKAFITGRKMAKQYLDALKEYHPDVFGNAFLVSTAQLMGVRESRRIVGDYILTLEDFLARRTFDDEISRNCYFVDVHFSKKDEDLHDKGKLVNDPHKIRYKDGESHGIPYRSLIPAKFNNVLVAGRMISCERYVLASIRTMPSCLAMGEGAGMAAAMAAKTASGNVRDIDVAKLRERLLEEGAYIK